jgi:hypothetical protein
VRVVILSEMKHLTQAEPACSLACVLYSAFGRSLASLGMTLIRQRFAVRRMRSGKNSLSHSRRHPIRFQRYVSFDYPLVFRFLHPYYVKSITVYFRYEKNVYRFDAHRFRDDLRLPKTKFSR